MTRAHHHHQPALPQCLAPNCLACATPVSPCSKGGCAVGFGLVGGRCTKCTSKVREACSHATPSDAHLPSLCPHCAHSGLSALVRLSRSISCRRPPPPTPTPYPSTHTLYTHNAQQGCVKCDGNASQCTACQVELDDSLNYYAFDPATKTCAAFRAHLS